MSDALCGPSNALQNFQKHSTVDRTLQQDRLTQRHSPTQGFRSSPGPNGGILDPEFEAFQAGQAGPPPQHLHFPPQQQNFAPQFAQAPQAPDWASDFQRLNIAPSHPPPLQQHHPQASNPAASWHMDFMGQQQAPSPQASSQQQNMFGGMHGSGMAWGGQMYQQRPMFGGMNAAPVSETAQGKQRVQDAMPEFDEAAFERAFEQAHQDALESAKPQESAQPQGHALQDYEQQLRRLEQQNATRIMSVETDPVLLRIRDTRPAIYGVLKLRSGLDTKGETNQEAWFGMLEDLEQSGRITEDASEARWVVDAIEKVATHESLSQSSKARAEKLIESVNERLMSTYPLLSSKVPISPENIWEELEAAGYTRTDIPEQVTHEQKPEQNKEEQPPPHADDEMAQTAGQLLERVADNTSSKFQNSQFLELMRRLRDREVRVEGDKMVDVSSNSAQISSAPLPVSSSSDPSNPSFSTSTVPIPPVDPTILNHAATDFEMPAGLADEEELSGLSRYSTSGPITDEISDQFSYYNTNATYHR